MIIAHAVLAVVANLARLAESHVAFLAGELIRGRRANLALRFLMVCRLPVGGDDERACHENAGRKCG